MTYKSILQWHGLRIVKLAARIDAHISTASWLHQLLLICSVQHAAIAFHGSEASIFAADHHRVAAADGRQPIYPMYRDL